MRVNMSLLDEGQEEEMSPVREEPVQDNDGMEEEDAVEEEDDGEDESDKYSRLKTVLLLAMMIGGFAIFVSNMTGLVNNMRLDNQGSATTNIVYEAQDRIDSFLGSVEAGSATISVEDHEESGVSTDAARDGPVSEDSDEGSEGTEDFGSAAEAVEAARKERDEALNYAALKDQELKNAEDMLDSALQKVDEQQQIIDSLNGNN